MPAMKVWNGTAWEVVSQQGPQGVAPPGIVRNAIFSNPALSVAPNSALAATWVTFTSPAYACRMYADVSVTIQATGAAGGNQYSAQIQPSSVPAPSGNTPAALILPTGGLMTIPVFGLWNSIAANTAVTIGIRFDVLGGASSGLLSNIWGSYELHPI